MVDKPPFDEPHSSLNDVTLSVLEDELLALSSTGCTCRFFCDAEATLQEEDP